MTKKPEVDITNCDQEQIHIPGSVQDFGSIVAYRKDGRITRASENVRELLESEAKELIGKDISTVFNSDDLEEIDKSCSELLRPSIVLTLKSGGKLNALWHSGADEQYLDLLAQTPDQNSYTSTMSSLGMRLCDQLRTTAGPTYCRCSTRGFRIRSRLEWRGHC